MGLAAPAGKQQPSVSERISFSSWFVGGHDPLVRTCQPPCHLHNVLQGGSSQIPFSNKRTTPFSETSAKRSIGPKKTPRLIERCDTSRFASPQWVSINAAISSKNIS
ncbi:MAG: hypothetical protein M2R46_03206 [Verrucomicrobia subdivision 3 bacterium]|nr:hypothetical protein [Limisphaerales bacterium]